MKILNVTIMMFISVLSLLLSGCGIIKCGLLDDCRSNPAAEEDVIEIPANRLFAYTGPPSNYATISITRDDNFVDSSCFDLLFINGQKIARIGIKERITIKVPAGELTIKASMQDHEGTWGCRSDRDIIREFTVSVDQHKKYRITHNVSPMDIDIQRTE